MVNNHNVYVYCNIFYIVHVRNPSKRSVLLPHNLCILFHWFQTIPYFSAHYISDHCISKPITNPNPDNSPDNDCSHLLVRDAVGRKGGHRFKQEYTKRQQ